MKDDHCGYPYPAPWPNLVKEMKLKHILPVEVATYIGFSRAKVIAIVEGKDDIDYNAAERIQRHFFPNRTVSYLFSTAKTVIIQFPIKSSTEIGGALIPYIDKKRA